jgi:hypothetical protein
MVDPAAARHLLIDAVLSRPVGGDAHSSAAAIQLAFTSFSADLAALIGHRSVQVLCDRGLHMASLKYPWLAPGKGARSNETLTDLQGRLSEGRSADEVRAASAALLIELTDNLATLIGESLTDRLLRRAWKLHAQDYANSENGE